jgi:hypothetical protein
MVKMRNALQNYVIDREFHIPTVKPPKTLREELSVEKRGRKRANSAAMKLV